MSKLTLSEAIKHCLEEAGELQKRADSAELIDILDGLDVESCKECAADHRQLAEWLTELKDLREENKVLMQECDRLIKEKGELNKLKEKAVLDICRREARLKETKRLLKAAVEDINAAGACETCEYYPINNSDMCQKDDCYKWCYADEVLKLLNDEK